MATLKEAVSQYLRNVESRSGRTSRAYTYTLAQFLTLVGEHKNIEAVTRQDLIDFAGVLRSHTLTDRTVANKVAEVITFLRHFGIMTVTFRVKFTEKAVRSYRPDELKALFAAATPDEHLLFSFFLMTGVREQEAMNAEWSDLDMVDNIFTVRAKADWRPKDYEERELPLPDGLVARLRERQRDGKSGLLFPTSRGNQDGHMLRRLKALAERAGVDDAILHKFRKTYATQLHRNGVDARTIQKRLGHSSLETTLAYLEGESARSDKARQQVNSTFAAFV